MAWKDWDRTNKVVVSLCTAVAVAVIATFAVIAFGPKTGPTGPTSSAPATKPPASPLPTYRCTTASGPDCTKDLAEKEAARQKAYAESEKALRTYNSELDKALQAGGVDKSLPEDLKRVLSSRMQKQELTELMLYRSTLKLYFKGDTKLRQVKVSKSTEPWPSTRIEYDVCLDSTKQFAVDSETDEHQGAGSIAKGTVITILDKTGQWVVDSKNLKGVKQC